MIGTGHYFDQGRLLQRVAPKYRLTDGEGTVERLARVRRLGAGGEMSVPGRRTIKCRGPNTGQKIAVFAWSKETRVTGR